MNNFRSNYGNNYYDIPVQNNLGYSNISKNYNKYSTRSDLNDHGGLGEVEFMLENERKKFKQTKDRFENELDIERKKRIQFENRLIKLKDEFSRKEVTVSQLEFKINNLLHANQDLSLQNEKLKNELGRLEQIYGAKIHELQSQLNIETKNFEDTTLQYNEEFNKFKKEGQDYVEQLTFQLERKIKNLEEKLKSTQMVKRDLAMENKKLNDLMISNRLEFEEHIRDLKNKTRDQQIKKAQYLTKNYEQKVKVVEDTKEGLSRKVQELLRALQDKQSKIADNQRQFEDELVKLRQSNTELQQRINHLNYLLNKVKSELAQKDSLIGRSLNQNDSESKSLRQQLENKKQENAQLQASLRQLRIALKDNEAEYERRKRELTERCNALDSQAKRYRQEYNRLAGMLKSKINSTIDNVSYTKRDK